MAEQLRAGRRHAARHPARAGRPQHRAGGRRGRAAGAWPIGADPVLLVLPADHVIARRGRPSARPCARRCRRRRRGALVTFGIVPTAPETGYGYIRRGAPADGGDCCAVRALRREAGRAPPPQRYRRRRRLLLEQRHVPVPRRRATWPSWSSSQPGDRSPRAARRWRSGQPRRAISAASTRPRSPPARPIRSTTR